MVYYADDSVNSRGRTWQKTLINNEDIEEPSNDGFKPVETQKAFESLIEERSKRVKNTIRNQ